MDNRPFSRRLGRCGRIVQNEFGDSIGGLSVQSSFFSRLDALLGGFRVGGGVHDSYTFPQTGGIFYFPWQRHQIEGTNGFYCLIRIYCLIRKTLGRQSGVNGIAKVPKRKVFTKVGLEPSTVRSPVDSLTHLATALPNV